MIRRFKFMNDNSPIPDDLASWMWDSTDLFTPNPDTQPYELITDSYHGILEFLSTFPPNYIVIVHEIRNPFTGFRHTANSERVGWGFDIQTDLIEVTYYRFLQPPNYEQFQISN